MMCLPPRPTRAHPRLKAHLNRPRPPRFPARKTPQPPRPPSHASSAPDEPPRSPPHPPPPLPLPHRLNPLQSPPTPTSTLPPTPRSNTTTHAHPREPPTSASATRGRKQQPFLVIQRVTHTGVPTFFPFFRAASHGLFAPTEGQRNFRWEGNRLNGGIPTPQWTVSKQKAHTQSWGKYPPSPHTHRDGDHPTPCLLYTSPSPRDRG